MATSFLFDGPTDARITLLLAHGAGAAMDSPSMTATAAAFGKAGIRVARFEFGYMASRRTPAGRKPPPRAESVMPEFIAAVDDLGPTPGPLLIGGKGDRIIITAGVPLRTPGSTNMLRIAYIGQEENANDPERGRITQRKAPR